MLVIISQKTGEAIIITVFILVSIWLLSNGHGGGRDIDYREEQYNTNSN